MAALAEEQPFYTTQMKWKSLARKVLQRKRQYDDLRDTASAKTATNIHSKRMAMMACYGDVPSNLSCGSSYASDLQENGVVASPSFSANDEATTVLETLLNEDYPGESQDLNVSRYLCKTTGDPRLTSGTALCLAISQGHMGAVAHLLKISNVDVNLGCPLWRAAATGQSGLVHMLLQRPDIDVNLGYRSTPLQAAAVLGHGDVISELLKHPNVNVNAWVCELIENATKDSVAHGATWRTFGIEMTEWNGDDENFDCQYRPGSPSSAR